MKFVSDFLVIGSGIAGLSYALKVAEFGKVHLITKSNDILETSTRYAQGGIAAVLNQQDDTYEKHIQDTLTCGVGLCNEEIVRMVVNEAPSQINELIKWGTNFDKNFTGEYDLAKEGGHSEKRILHHKDNTGFEIQRALSEEVKKNKNITIFNDHFTVEIITQHHQKKLVKRGDKDIQCFGAYIFNNCTKKVDTFLAKSTLLATGGIGSVYLTTTNPIISTGDGIAMVYRAKGEIENMEFVQFHPTSLYNPSEKPSFLITEAMRGFGAILKTTDGKEFMHKYDSRGSLAPRDIVARAIDNEMKISGEGFVYLDATNLNAEELINHFPNIHSKCLGLGIDITKNMIPVTPASHYSCGGIKVDKDGKSSINHLYAAGEVTSTGMHGANRLASNSLLEAVVFADRAAKAAVNESLNTTINNKIPEWNDEGTTHNEELILITQSMKEMQQIMSNYVGIVRSNLRLKRALDRLEILYDETEDLYKKSKISVKLCELRNLINVGYLIIRMGQQRKESIGLHYNLDYTSVGNKKH